MARTIKIYYKFIDDMFEIFELYSHTYDHIRANKENRTKHFRNLFSQFIYYFRNFSLFSQFIDIW